MKTINEIPLCKFMTIQANHACRHFLGSLINDKWILREQKKLSYSLEESKTLETFYVFTESAIGKLAECPIRNITFDFWNSLLSEFFWANRVELKVPVNYEWKDFTLNVMDLLRQMAKERIIDDLLYVIYSRLIMTLRVFYDSKNNRMWFWTKWERFAIINGNRFKISAQELRPEDILTREVEQWFINKNLLIWDPEKWYGFTHYLRSHAKYKLFWWQKEVLMMWTRYNIIATSRWQWKTYLAAFVCARELLKEWTWFWWRPFREIKYFVPDKENVGTEFFQYLEALIWDMQLKKLPNGLKVIEINRQKYTVKCNITGHILKVVSLFKMGWWWELWSSIGEGIAADVAVIDEAARIPDSFWSSFHQRAAFETDTFFIISTINEETPSDHWFYKLVIDWEWDDPTIRSYRIDIDKNELLRIWKTEEEYQIILEKAKDALRIKWDKEFYAKWYCIILDESNVFNTSSYTSNSEINKYQDSDPRILWFDLGKLTDTCWLVLINLKHMEIEESRKVLNATYGTQLQYAKEYKDKYRNILIIWDRTWVGEAVSEQDIEWVVDCWIKSTWAWELTYNKKNQFYTCSKWKIITIMATVLNSRILRIPTHNDWLLEQMKDFVKLKSWRGDILLYKGKWKKKDDLVLSAAYAILYMYAILWLKTKTLIEEYCNMSWNSSVIDYADNTEYDSNYYNRLY